MTPLCPVCKELMKEHGRSFRCELCRQFIVFFDVSDASSYNSKRVGDHTLSPEQPVLSSGSSGARAMVSTDHFRQGLLAQMDRASLCGLIDVLINSGELYRSLGGYPGSTHGMPFCCGAMEAEMKPGDILLVERASGAGMTVRYLLPRGVA